MFVRQYEIQVANVLPLYSNSTYIPCNSNEVYEAFTPQVRHSPLKASPHSVTSRKKILL